MSRRCLTLAILAVTLAVPRAAWADDAVTRDIMAFRETVRTAVKAKDEKGLEQLYADNFKHIRDTGRTDAKRERIASLLVGEDSIETAAEEDIVIEAYGPATAVATGLSPVKDPRTGRSTRFQWLAVYVRSDARWMLAMSQASRYTARQ